MSSEIHDHNVILTGDVLRKTRNRLSKGWKRCVLTLRQDALIWREKGPLKPAHEVHLSDIVTVMMVADDSNSGCVFEVQVYALTEDSSSVTSMIGVEFKTETKEETQQWIVAVHQAKYEFDTKYPEYQSPRKLKRHESLTAPADLLSDQKEDKSESVVEVLPTPRLSGGTPERSRAGSRQRSNSARGLDRASEGESKSSANGGRKGSIRKFFSNDTLNTIGLLKGHNHARRWSFSGESKIPHVEKGVFLTQAPCVISNFRIRLWERINNQPNLLDRDRRRLLLALYLINDDSELLKLMMTFLTSKANKPGLSFLNFEFKQDVDAVTEYQWRLHAELCEFLIFSSRGLIVQATSCFFTSNPFFITGELSEDHTKSLDELCSILQALCIRFIWSVHLFDAGLLSSLMPLNREAKSEGDESSDIMTIGHQNSSVMMALSQYIEQNFSPAGKSLLQQDVVVETLFRILIDFFSTTTDPQPSTSGILTDSDQEIHETTTNSSARSNSRSRDKERTPERDAVSRDKDREKIRDLRRFKDEKGKGGGSRLRFHKRSISTPQKLFGNRRLLTSNALDSLIVRNGLGAMAFLGSNVVWSEAWRACFVAMRAAGTDPFLVNESMRNATALTVGSWKNVCSIVQWDEWSSWIVPFTILPSSSSTEDEATVRVRQDTQSVSLGLVTNLLLQCFYHTKKFHETLRGVMRNMAHYGISKDLPDQSLHAAGHVLESMIKRLSSSNDIAVLTSGTLDVGWFSLQSLFAVIRELVFQSALWCSTSHSRSLRSMTIFEKSKGQMNKSLKFAGKEWSMTTSSITSDDSLGLHLSNSVCMDTPIVEACAGLLRTMVVELESANSPEELRKNSGLVSSLSTLQDELSFFEHALKFMTWHNSRSISASKSRNLCKKLLQARGFNKMLNNFRSELDSFKSDTNDEKNSHVSSSIVDVDSNDLAAVRGVLEARLELKDRSYMFQKYKACFAGADLVKCLMSAGIAKDSREANKIANSLVAGKHIVCISHPDSVNFSSENTLFKFSENNKPQLYIDEEEPLRRRLSGQTSTVNRFRRTSSTFGKTTGKKDKKNLRQHNSEVSSDD